MSSLEVVQIRVIALRRTSRWARWDALGAISTLVSNTAHVIDPKDRKVPQLQIRDVGHPIPHQLGY